MKGLSYVVVFLILYLKGNTQIFYRDISADLEITHTYTNGIPGGGVSYCDFDQDGWDDLTLATGPGENIQFYTNNQGIFELIFPLVDHNEKAQQVLWLDFDNDGDKDFYVATHQGTNRLYENQGNLRLVDITQVVGLAMNEGLSYGACWGDYNRDGRLDLYYSDRKGPLKAEQNECRLFRNNANGRFTEVTYDAGVADLGKKPFCSAFLDYNNDGWPDIYSP